MISNGFRIKSFIVLSIMAIGIAVIYPKFIHRILLYFVGFNEEYKDKNEFIPPKMRSNDYRDNVPKMRHSKAETIKEIKKKSSIWSLFIPIYGIGIFLYFLYNLNKDSFGTSSFQYKWISGSNKDKSDKYCFNGLSEAEVNSWKNKKRTDQADEYTREKNSLKRDDILRLVNKVQEEDLEEKEIEVIYSRLQDAESKLVTMMDKMKSMHDSYSNFVNTLSSSSLCPKVLLEDDYIQMKEENESLHTASEGED